MWLFLFTCLVYAQDYLVNEVIQGGLASDTSGVSVPPDGGTKFFKGKNLELLIPASATIHKLYAVVVAKSMPSGSAFTGNPAPHVRIAGVPLSKGQLVKSHNRYRVFELDPQVFGITGAGSYTYEEFGRIEPNPKQGPGVSGTTLYAVFKDTAVSPKRHVIVAATYSPQLNLRLDTIGIREPGSQVTSVTIAYTCPDEQGGRVRVENPVLTPYAGGADDGSNPKRCTDYNSLITGGSFGYNDHGRLQGVSGDDPDYEEKPSTQTPSRLSDELWRTTYDGSGKTSLYFQGRYGFLASFGIVIEGKYRAPSKPRKATSPAPDKEWECTPIAPKTP